MPFGESLGIDILWKKFKHSYKLSKVIMGRKYKTKKFGTV